MIMPLMTVEEFKDFKVKLTIPLITKLLLEAMTVSQIARQCNVSPQAVSQFIKRHYDKIIVNADPTGKLLAYKNKLIAAQATDHIDKILSIETFTKRDLQSLSIVNGVATDKMRLLQGESTQNLSVASSERSIKDIDSELDAIMTKVKELE